MSLFRCKPFVGGHVPPASAGSALEGPRDWSVSDDGSASGDILRLDVTAPPPVIPGFKITHYELALSQRNGATTIRRVLGGPTLNYQRRFRTDSPVTPQRVQLRSVQQYLNQMRWNAAEDYVPRVNDAASQPTTGASAQVAALADNGNGTFTLTLANFQSATAFAGGQITVLRGRPGRTLSASGNTLVWESYRFYVPRPGDAMSQLNGATARLRKILPITASAGLHYLVLEDISGTFEDEQITFVNGEAGVQGSALHCTHDDEARVTVMSEWSLPRDITPAPGTPQVEITASKASCMQGEGVIFEATATGFEAERPIHDLRYRFFVTKPGEQGTYAALPGSFATCFGTGSNNRAESFAQVWAFAPRTTGIIEVRCEVRDEAGNVATSAPFELTSLAPLSVFAPGEIYAASATLRAVPGAPEARVYATLEQARAAVPTGNTRALVLLDTTDTMHGAGAYTELNFRTSAGTRLALMPYNASGVGVAANARASMNHGIVCQSKDLSTFGINLVGPYDSTDPFSISQHPTHGLNTDQVGYNSIVECNITGWRENAKLPWPGNKAAYVDVYNTDYQNFGWFGGDVGAHAMSGVYTFTNPRAWRAAGKGDATDNATRGFFVDHGPYRSSRPTAARGLSKCVFFSCCSWGGADGYCQPTLRLFGDADTDRPNKLHGSEVLTEGVHLPFDATSRGGGDATTHPQDARWDKFFHITSLQPLSSLSVGIGGLTLRNGVFATSENPAQVVGSGVRNHLAFSNENSIPGQNDNENNPINISYLSIIDLRVDSGQKTNELIIAGGSAEFPMKNVNIEMGTLLTYAPNFTLSDVASAPLDTMPRWTPHYAGEYIWNFDTPTISAQVPKTSLATPPTVTASFEPGAGSNAYRGASGVVAIDDIRSRLRPQAGASRGAYDPDAV